MTTSGETEFRRLVLDLCTTTPDAAALRMAGELARLLRLDLRGLFVEDPALSLLAGLPGVRELRFPGAGWARLDAARIAQETHQVAARAERMLAEISAAVGVPSGFETRRGQVADIIAATEPTDILVIAEPRRPSERAGEAFLRCCHAAFRSAASVLVVPASRGRAHGPIVALSRDGNDTSLRTAIRVAGNAGEKLIVLAPDTETQRHASEQARAAGLRPDQIQTRRLEHADDIAVARILAEARPRLLVLMRGSTLGEDLNSLLRLAHHGGVPVLAVEPATNPA